MNAPRRDTPRVHYGGKPKLQIDNYADRRIEMA